ncbi:MAG: hypothetical protein ACI4DN_11105 [Lachnospiraceae bacterium]
MKTKASKTSITYIVIFFILTALVYPTWTLLSNYLNTENYEKRELTQVPSFSLDMISEFPHNFETYVNDNLPFRNQLISLNSALNYYLFHSSTSPRVVIGKNGWLFYDDKGDGNPISNYHGTDLLTDEELQQIAFNLTVARDDLASRGIEFVVFIAPNKERIYSENMADYYGEPADEYGTQQIVDYLHENTDLRVIFPVEEIREAKEDLSDKINIYHKTDTHWNELGAYIGTSELLKELGVNIPVYNSNEIIVKEYEDIPGDLADMLNIGALIDPGKNYIPTGYDAHDYINVEWDFSTVFRYCASAADPRKIVINRDSFCSAMAELIGSQFDESVMIHRKHYSRDMILDEKPDIYVYETVERYAAKGLLNINSIY